MVEQHMVYRKVVENWLRLWLVRYHLFVKGLIEDDEALRALPV